MGRKWGMLSGALAGLFGATVAAAALSGAWERPGSLPGLFLTVLLSGGPVAAYYAFLLRDYLESSSTGRSSLRRIRFEAHAISVGLAACLVGIVLSWSSLLEGPTAETFWIQLPRTAAVALAGCTGLAWGILATLPVEETP